MSRRMSVVTIVLLLASLFLLPATVGAEGITDAQPTTARYSHRLIVELQSAPLAEWNAASAAIAASGETRTVLNVNTPAAQQYLQKLQGEQAAFVAAMQQAIPNAKVATYLDETGAAVPATYQVVLNGVAVDAGRNVDVLALRERLQRLPGVQAVYLDFAHDPDMYASLPLINASAAWNNAAIGGKANAGAGIKFASMDGGVHNKAPMFDGTGYAYPPGFPQGDKRNNNGKIILSKMYFRTWDPPKPTDAFPWPVTGTPHGTHTSSTAVGNEVSASYLGTPVTLSGVAPKAWVMSYRVFYDSIMGDGSFYNVEGIKALEDIAVDDADVLNNSWGGGPTSTGGEFDALDKALINVARAGTFVSMSNGNAGPNLATGDHPSPDYINVAASSTTGTFASGLLKVTAPAPAPSDMQAMAYGVTSGFGKPLPIGTIVGPYSYVTSASVDATNAEGCNAFPAGAFTGKAAVIIRGTCNFSLKILNAQNAGAAFVVIYNQAAAGDTIINMGAGTGAADVIISAVLIGNTNGKKVVAWYGANPTTAQLAVDTTAYQAGNTPDIIASFSSRGPGVGNVLKPDIAAPGVNILAQGYDPSKSGEAGVFGFGQASGTSMAAPHVSGAAALLRQIHPTWGNAWIKSALMSSSKYMDIYVNSARTIPAQPLDMGAGRLDLTNAADPGVILNPPSLSFGQMYSSTTRTIEVQVTSVAAAAETYAVSTLYTGMGYASTTPVAGMTVDPASLTLAPGETKTLKVTWSTAASLGYGDNQGFVILTGSSHNAHVPAWMRVALWPTALTTPPYGKVLIIDADGSANLGMPNYTPYYANALTVLGVPYDIWDADAHVGGAATVPDAVTLAQYTGILLQTGDNYCPSTGTSTTCKGTNRPLTTLDMDRLLEYANNGGHIVSFGQDLASVTGSATFPPTGNNHSFYSWLLNGGEGYLQDSVNAEQVFTDTAQLLTGYPGGYSPVRWMSFDISARGDGAGNQYYMDEIFLRLGRYGCGGWDSPDRELCLDQYQPWLKYAPGGQQIMSEGIVAMSHRDQPTLERPGVSFKGTSVYFSFGLEGVNNNTGYYGREQLLAQAVAWSVDAVSVVVTPTAIAPVGQVSYFQARLTSSVLMPAWNYRWDFGDGTEFTNIYPSVVGHTYAQPGVYTVRVQGTDAYGTRGLGSTTVTVPQVYDVPETQTFPAAQDSFIDGGLPNSNYGGWGQLFVRSDDLVRSLYQFDLSGVNPLYPVTKATLYLWVDAFSGGGSPAELHAFELTTPWNESTVTWKTPWTLPGGDFTGAAAGTTPIVKTDVGTWKQIDITALAQKWVADPAANKGVVIRLRNFTSFTGYRLTSSEYWVPANLPKLEVTYLKP